MNFKTNTMVNWTTTNKRIARAWKQACREVVGKDYVSTLTSGMDGTHSKESGHYHGRALDFKKSDIAVRLRRKLKARVMEILGKNYLCLMERTHFHIQRQKNTF